MTWINDLRPKHGKRENNYFSMFNYPHASTIAYAIIYTSKSHTNTPTTQGIKDSMRMHLCINATTLIDLKIFSVSFLQERSQKVNCHCIVALILPCGKCRQLILTLKSKKRAPIYKPCRKVVGIGNFSHACSTSTLTIKICDIKYIIIFIYHFQKAASWHSILWIVEPQWRHKAALLAQFPN